MNPKLRPTIFERALALIIDFFIIGIIGFVSGLFLEDFYVSLGRYGTLVGSMITIVYFAIWHSSIGKGQSIGKKVIGAKVTDFNCSYLTFNKAFLRALIVFFPVLNIELLSRGNGFMIITILVVLSLLASVYLILVNKSRRCLHDLLVSSVVIKKQIFDLEMEDQNDSSYKKLIPIGVFSVLMIGAGLYFSFSKTMLSQSLAIKEKIEQKKGVVSVNEVQSNVTTHYNLNEPVSISSSVHVSVRIDDENEVHDMNSKFFKECYDIIRNEMPESGQVNQIGITLYYGYNIGIAHKEYAVTKTFNN